MLASFVLAATLAFPVRHQPVTQAVQPVVTSRPISRPEAGEVGGGEDRVQTSSYCDVKHQPTILLTNTGDSDLVVEWTLTALTPGYPTDRWSSVSLVAPGRFEGWMTPAPYLHLEIRYDDDGLPKTQSVDATCDFSGLSVHSFESSFER